MITVGQFIRRLRLDHGDSQERLAEKINVSGKQIVHIWETGKGGISQDNLDRILEVYNVNLEIIFDDNYNKKPITKRCNESVFWPIIKILIMTAIVLVLLFFMVKEMYLLNMPKELIEVIGELILNFYGLIIIIQNGLDAIGDIPYKDRREKCLKN